MDQSPLEPGLYIVATPIGNLNDMTLRAANVLKQAALVAVEDTRVTGKLLKHVGSEARMIRYDEHQGERNLDEILSRAEGEAVALVSDAGTPLISDPGYRLVAAAHERNVRVHAVPGPSAVIAALSIAGLPTDRFTFMGFLPPKSGPRQAALAEVKDLRSTLVFYETGKRLAAFFADAWDVLGNREVRLVREITKLHEEYSGFPLSAAEGIASDVRYRGEIVVVIGPPGEAPEPDDEDIDEALIQHMADDSLKASVAAVTARLKVPRKRVYERALIVKDRHF